MKALKSFMTNRYSICIIVVYVSKKIINFKESKSGNLWI